MMFSWFARRSRPRPESPISRPAKSLRRACQPRVEELEPRVVLTTDLFTVPGADGAEVRVAFNWVTRDAAYDNEVGVFVVEDDSGTVGGLAPGQPGYDRAALQNSQILFSRGQGAGASRELTFLAGDRLAFFLAQHATALGVRSRNPDNVVGRGPIAFFSVDGAAPDGFDHVQSRALGDRTTQFAWEDITGGGDLDFNDVVFTAGVAGERATLTPGQTGQTVAATFTRLQRDTVFSNELGLFVVEDASGRVGGLRPGEAGYLTAALSSATRQRIFASGSDASSATLTLPAGAFFGMYLVANGTAEAALASNPGNSAGGSPVVYFSFVAANPDGFDHLRWNSATDFAWEDLVGGGDADFNDLVARVEFGATDGQPPATTPPDTTAPARPDFDLDEASDTGDRGDGRTDLGVVTLVGRTDPNTQVRLVQTGAPATSDGSGRFSFGNVPLAVGANTFTVRAIDAAGNTSEATRIITLSSGPFVRTALPAVPLTRGGSTTLDLAGTFDDADIANTLVRLDTSGGPVTVELFDRQAPRTVANFFNYITDGDYTNSIFHRSAKLLSGAPFVLQGGGFTFRAGPSRLEAVPTDPTVQNEPDAANRSNVRGTLAMAKRGGDPNSATSQFFFNLGDNSADLDNNNGGFTVFGRLASAADQQVIDALAAIPTQNQGNAAALPLAQRGVFTEIPLQGYSGTNFPTDTVLANYAVVSGVTIVRRTEELTYSVVANTNPAAVTATVTRNRLTLQATALGGTATITVRATDRSGAFVDTTVTVTVA